jgi:hypothetical protein
MNANDQLREHTCSDNYYKYNFGLVITSGVKALAEKFECFWLIDIIGSYQRDLKGEEFQVWKLVMNEDDSAFVTCTDGNDRQLKKQRIEWTGFKATECTIWVEFGTALLPSEH